jgi:hypothetical protein
MKKFLFLLAFSFIVGMGAVFAQGQLDGIIVFKVADAGVTSASLKGTGMNGFKLTVGDEIFIMAKGNDSDGKEVAIWPTWKADKELAVSVVEGKSKVVKVKALKAGAPLFISAIYIDDTGKKHEGGVMGEVKEKAK